MVCSEYQERINKEALVGSAANSAEMNSSAESLGDADLQKHLAVCAGCREEFELRRALIARIDFGVSAMVAEEPSPAIAVLVRQRIAEASAESRSFSARWGWWIGATAAAAALAAIGFVVMTRSPARGISETPAGAANVAAQPAHDAAPAVVQPPVNGIQERRPQTAIVRAIPQRHERALVASASTRSTEIGPPRFEVIVPPGQREAVFRLAAGLQSGRVDGSVFVNPAPPLVPEFLEITPLEIKPLAADVDSGSEADSTKDLDPAVHN